MNALPSYAGTAPPPATVTPEWTDLRFDARMANEHYACGKRLAAEQKPELAIEAYRMAAGISPSCARYLMAYGQMLYGEHRHREAAIAFGRVVEIWPDNVDALVLLGVSLHKMGRLDDAIGVYLKAMERYGPCAQILTNLGTAYQDKGDLQQALVCQRHAVRLEPRLASGHNNLGVSLMKMGRYEEAYRCFAGALRIDPQHPGAHFNIGYGFQELGSLEMAEKYYLRALELKPTSETLRFYLGTLHLQQGSYVAGWREYESRWNTRHQREQKRNFAQPQWRGEPIAGQRILLHAEQGFGDTIQFVRYATLVAQRGAEVILEVQPRLKRLMTGLPGVRVVLARGERLPEFEWHCPLLSLPFAFQTELESIPHAVPYLQARPADVARWKQNFDPEKFNVGVVWGGNPKHPRDAARSLPLLELAGLMRLPGTQFYSLQKGTPVEQIGQLPGDPSLIDLDGEQRDFYDTAAITANLDLVISIDTSVAHLAGAVGVPLWIMLHQGADWRWLTGRNDSPWYPTARLFRKKQGEDWQGVVQRIRRELRLCSRRHSARTATCATGSAPR